MTDTVDELLARVEQIAADLAETIGGLRDFLPPPPGDVTFPDVWVLPASEVPVDGSVDIRTGINLGPWERVVGEEPSGRDHRCFLIKGRHPWVVEAGHCVQVRRHTPHDRRAADAQWDAANGGL